jgi:hypothetical protein
MSAHRSPAPRPRDTSEWRTPAEASGYRATPEYADTLRFIDRIAAAHPETVRVEEFGRTGEGRELKIVIVSRKRLFDPAAIHRAGRAVLLVQNCIHPGEPDGKDACLALLRDLVQDPTCGKLLEHVVLVFIPVYNIDGHERRSPFHRINQNGPRLAGWRGNGTNLNLNRDYMKADAPETRAFLRMFHRWMPDFFVDDHVTDGADFQYDVTFALDSTPDVPAPTAAWVRETVSPELVRQVGAAGHLAFPSTVFLKDDTDPSCGLAFNENPPRFSTGRVLLEGRPSLLVEMHMLKDYRTRVGGNYALLRAVMDVMNRQATTLIALNRRADRDAVGLGGRPRASANIPLVIEGSGSSSTVPFRGREFTRYLSEVSGAMAVRYGPKPWKADLPADLDPRVATAVAPPAGYIIPPPWTEVIEVLEAQGIELRRTSRSWTGRVGLYRCSGMQWPTRPFEGRFPILRGGNVEREFGRFGKCVLSTGTSTFPRRSAVVSLRQRLSKVAVHWLEPEAPDSALRWGFFGPIFEQKEYGEAYALERLAREELRRDPATRTEFEQRVHSDPDFARNPSGRLSFFYDRSRWGRANRVGEYPVGRLLSLRGLPLER